VGAALVLALEEQGAVSVEAVGICVSDSSIVPTTS